MPSLREVEKLLHLQSPAAWSLRLFTNQFATATGFVIPISNVLNGRPACQTDSFGSESPDQLPLGDYS